MTRRVNTIIFVPHARARFRQFHISTRALVLSGAALLLVLLTGTTFAVLWFRSARRTREVSELVAQNRDLRGRAKLLSSKLESIEKQLAEFEERTRRLSIVAGLSGVRDTGTGGVGGVLTLPADASASADRSLADLGRREMTVSSNLAAIEKRLALHAEHLASTPTITPTLGVLTAGFGSRSDPFTGEPELHTGIDVSTQAGNRVIAPAAGTVVHVEWRKGYGRVVEIAHGGGVTTLYGHLEATRVAEGQRVRRGELVGLVGSSGRSTGPHLHYEVHVNGRPQNPLEYVLNAF